MLDFFAGKEALTRIRDRGLHPQDVSIVAGAAGGPKWLILNRLDHALFDRSSGWFKNRKSPLHLVGSSSGAWRFAAVSQADPSSAIDRFEAAYISQRYARKPSPHEVSREGRRILERLLGDRGIEEILSHPFLRLTIATVRCNNALVSFEAPSLQGAAMAAAACLNAMDRKTLKFFFERVLFHDPRSPAPLSGVKPPADGLPSRSVPLGSQNLKPALLASGSIPLIMSGVSNIPGAPRGVYRDGGVIDYHMDLPYSRNTGIVLFPHYTHRVIPGWLDKHLPWRQPNYLENTLAALPSKAFLDRLPYQKIPDRDDFWTFVGRDRQRMAYWRQATEMGQRLADDFMEAVGSGRIRDRVRPYEPAG